MRDRRPRDRSVDDELTPPSESAHDPLKEHAPILRAQDRRRAHAPPEAAFADATRGGAAELPHRRELEESFGQDLSGVQAFTGRKEAMQPLGAHAVAGGEQVAFADANPSKELVA